MSRGIYNAVECHDNKETERILLCGMLGAICQGRQSCDDATCLDSSRIRS